MAFNTDYSGNSPEERRLARILEHEVEKTEGNRVVRQQSLNAVMGWHAQDDRASRLKPWLRDIVWNPLWRDLQWLTGQAMRRELSVKVFPRAKHTDMMARMAAAKREWQVRATLSSTRFMKKMGKAFEDAAISGQGWVGVDTEPGRDGRIVYKARRLSWASEFTDSQVHDEDMREAKYHFSIRWQDVGVMKLMFPDVPDHIWDANAYGAPAGRDFLDFSPSQGWGGYFGVPWHTTTGGELWGEYAGRKGIAYGLVWFESFIAGERRFGLMEAPFILSRAGMKVIFIGEPTPAHRIPRMQIVAARNPHNGDPFSPRVLFANGLDRAIHYLLRAGLDKSLVRRVVMGMGAVPDVRNSDGSPLFSPKQYLAKVQSWDVDGGVLPTADPGQIVVETEQDQVNMALGLMDKMIQLSEVNSSVHAALKGERSSVTAGVAMRELTDNAINAENNLYGTALQSVQDAGEWFLGAINILERWSDFGQIGSTDGGMETLSPEVSGLRIGPDDLRKMRLGMEVTPIDKSQVTTPERYALAQEIIKLSDPENPHTRLWAMSIITPGNPKMRAEAEFYIQKGIYVADDYLLPDQVQRRDKVMREMGAKRAEAERRAAFAENAKAGKDVADMIKKLVEAGVSADEAERLALEMDGRANEQAAGGGNAWGGQGGGEFGAGGAQAL